MKIYGYKNNSISEEKYLYKALGIDLKEKNIISFVGGGGKTTSVYTLARELSNLGKKVLVTTTTHMHMPNDCIDFKGDVKEITERLKIHNLVTVGIKEKNDKISSVGEDIAEALINLCDFLIIEADGAKMLPLKAPASHEPVILKNTTMVVGVAGIDSLNKSIKETCHRPQQVCNILKQNDNYVIKPKDIAILLSSEKGQKKGVHECKNAIYRALINKVDNKELLDLAEEICEYLQQNNIKSIITSYKEFNEV